MDLTNAPQFFFGRVMHKRFAPKVNAFTYGVYYIALPLSKMDSLVPHIAINRPACLSFYEADHGPCDGSPLEPWARGILEAYKVQADGEIVLICMPRLMGYVFNPVSFWLCHDGNGGLKAVLCEVRNTFGERHIYLCADPNGHILTGGGALHCQKIFHVSPFFTRKGLYRFRFDLRGDGAFGAWIDYHGPDGEALLHTSLTGKCREMNRAALRRALWRYPLVTFKVIALIHWQALKLAVKGVAHVRKPPPKPRNISATGCLLRDDRNKPPAPAGERGEA